MSWGGRRWHNDWKASAVPSYGRSVMHCNEMGARGPTILHAGLLGVRFSNYLPQTTPPLSVAPRSKSAKAWKVKCRGKLWLDTRTHTNTNTNTNKQTRTHTPKAPSCSHFHSYISQSSAVSSSPSIRAHQSEAMSLSICFGPSQCYARRPEENRQRVHISIQRAMNSASAPMGLLNHAQAGGGGGGGDLHC